MTNTNFQSESTASGDEFERIVNEDLISKGYTILETNVKIPDIGINVDCIAEKNGVKGIKNIRASIKIIYSTRHEFVRLYHLYSILGLLSHRRPRCTATT